MTTRECLWILALATLGGCDGTSDQVSIEPRIVSIGSDVVVFEVRTAPDTVVYHDPGLVSAEVDAQGLARLEVPTNVAGDAIDHVAHFEVVSPALFGAPDRVGSADLPLGFDPLPLTMAPGAGPSWVRLLDGLEEERCVHLFDYEGSEPEQFGRGTVASDGGTFVGPAGTVVELAGVSLTIPESGFLRWQPSGEELRQILRPGLAYHVPTAVTSPGGPRATGRLTVNNGPACERVLGAHLRERLDAGALPLPESPVDGAMFVRAGGALEFFRPPGRRGAPLPHPGPEPPRFEEATHVVLEEEISRTGPQASCVASGYELVRADTGQYHSSVTISHQPVHVTTRVSVLNRASGETLGSRTFEVGPHPGCAPVLYPDALDVRAWVWEVAFDYHPRRR